MSKYMTFPDAAFKDRELLIKALIELGWRQDQIEVHDKQESHLFGYHGDQRPETAEVVIRRKHIGAFSNDLGFTRNQAGALVPIISEYDQGVLERKFKGNPVARLRTEYSQQVAQRTAAKLRGRMSVQRVGQTRKITISY